MSIKFFYSKDEEQFQIVDFDNCDQNTVYKAAFDFIKSEQKKHKTIFGYKIL